MKSAVFIIYSLLLALLMGCIALQWDQLRTFHNTKSHIRKALFEARINAAHNGPPAGRWVEYYATCMEELQEWERLPVWVRPFTSVPAC